MCPLVRRDQESSKRGGRSGGATAGRISRWPLTEGGAIRSGKREEAGAAGKTKTMAVTKERSSVWQQDMEHWSKPKPV